MKLNKHYIDNDTYLIGKIRKNNDYTAGHVYHGIVQCVHNEHGIIWERITGIDRFSKIDCHCDCEELIKDIIEREK